jgi:intracellular sulfur oxidation DsrE/DsrF family protein
MLHRTLLTSIIMAAMLLSSSIALAASDRYEKQKVVYHINYDNPKKQTGALRNIQNHINAVGAENMEIKVVMHGNGLSLLLEPEALARVPKFKHANADEKMTARIDSLKGQGVKFNVCANTVKGRKVNTETDLYDFSAADVVPSGVAELSHLQMQGYTYIKP